MNTNPDAFENDLRALRRRALPDEWRSEMLQAAAAAGAPPVMPKTHAAPAAARAPRWLVAGWSLAWAATVVMYFTTPPEPAAPLPSYSAEMPDSTAPPALLWDQRAAAIAALVASN
ncbi:hypothetical protein [Prosthecobacter sp.]|uniref:hypothetical protein n=1 Tax=Prosthecobacter sp. TaxID=1965333 RepID=UPI003784F784